MTNKTLSRNPSFTPSPKLRAYLESSEKGVTAALNELYDQLNSIQTYDAIRLSPEGQQKLKEHMQAVYVDEIALQAVREDVHETGDQELIDKLSNATYGQIWATLKRYKIV